MPDLLPFVPRVNRGPSLARMLHAIDHYNEPGAPAYEPPHDFDPEGSRILGCIRDLIDGAYEQRLEPVVAVRLSHYDAMAASRRIKNMQHDISAFRDVPDWARWEAPPASRFLGIDIIEDESVLRGQIRVVRGGKTEDYRLDPAPGSADA